MAKLRQVSLLASFLGNMNLPPNEWWDSLGGICDQLPFSSNGDRYCCWCCWWELVISCGTVVALLVRWEKSSSNSFFCFGFHSLEPGDSLERNRRRCRGKIYFLDECKKSSWQTLDHTDWLTSLSVSFHSFLSSLRSCSVFLKVCLWVEYVKSCQRNEPKFRPYDKRRTTRRTWEVCHIVGVAGSVWLIKKVASGKAAQRDCTLSGWMCIFFESSFYPKNTERSHAGILRKVLPGMFLWEQCSRSMYEEI